MIKATKIQKPATKEFEVYEADVYQVQITDVDEREGTKYASSDKIMQYMFKAVMVEGENAGKPVVFFTSQSWFDGGEGSNPSKLFNLISTIYAFYEKEIDVKAIEEITDKEINGIVGKQLRLTMVKIQKDSKDKGKNKVTGFMPIKKEIPFKAKEISTGDDPFEV